MPSSIGTPGGTLFVPEDARDRQRGPLEMTFMFKILLDFTRNPSFSHPSPFFSSLAFCFIWGSGTCDRMPAPRRSQRMSVRMLVNAEIKTWGAKKGKDARQKLVDGGHHTERCE